MSLGRRILFVALLPAVLLATLALFAIAAIMLPFRPHDEFWDSDGADTLGVQSGDWPDAPLPYWEHPGAATADNLENANSHSACVATGAKQDHA